jgi:non-canonical poly(A) RNA polymerase PAPD5/7
VACYGSTATGTYLPTSDINFVVMHESGDINLLLTQLGRHLDLLKVFQISDVIQNAQNSIIKGVESPFGFQIDISINSESGALNVERTRHLLATYPAMYPLLMLTKLFLHQHQLDEPSSGGIGSNTLQNMVVFIIQASPPDCQLHLGQLLLAFFKTFGQTFDYITTGISTRGDGRLFSKLDTNQVNWSRPFRLSIENPQVPGQFLGENAFQAVGFRKCCDEAYRRLMEGNTERWHSQAPSLLVRLIVQPCGIIRKKKELKEYYQVLMNGPTDPFWRKLDGSTPGKGRLHARERKA